MLSTFVLYYVFMVSCMGIIILSDMWNKTESLTYDSRDNQYRVSLLLCVVLPLYTIGALYFTVLKRYPNWYHKLNNYVYKNRL